MSRPPPPPPRRSAAPPPPPRRPNSGVNSEPLQESTMMSPVPPRRSIRPPPPPSRSRHPLPPRSDPSDELPPGQSFPARPPSAPTRPRVPSVPNTRNMPVSQNSVAEAARNFPGEGKKSIIPPSFGAPGISSASTHKNTTSEQDINPAPPRLPMMLRNAAAEKQASEVNPVRRVPNRPAPRIPPVRAAPPAPSGSSTKRVPRRMARRPDSDALLSRTLVSTTNFVCVDQSVDAFGDRFTFHDRVPPPPVYKGVFKRYLAGNTNAVRPGGISQSSKSGFGSKIGSANISPDPPVGQFPAKPPPVPAASAAPLPPRRAFAPAISNSTGTSARGSTSAPIRRAPPPFNPPESSDGVSAQVENSVPEITRRVPPPRPPSATGITQVSERAAPPRRLTSVFIKPDDASSISESTAPSRAAPPSRRNFTIGNSHATDDNSKTGASGRIAPFTRPGSVINSTRRAVPPAPPSQGARSRNASPRGSISDQLSKLEDELQRSIAASEFEKCADLRDQIQALKSRQDSTSPVSLDMNMINGTLKKLDDQMQEAISTLRFELCVGIRDQKQIIEGLVKEFDSANPIRKSEIADSIRQSCANV